MAKTYLSVDSLTYEAVQKCFRNAIVSLIRQQLKASFGEDWRGHLVNTFGSEWSSIAQSANNAALTGVVSRSAIDEADLLSVNHFYNLFERFFLEIVDESLRPSGDALKPFKNSILNCLRDIKAIRDPISHPPEEDLSPFDALNVVHNIARVLRALCLKEPLHQLEAVRSELARRAAALEPGELPAPQSLSCSLPRREEMFDRFIGRTTEMEDLWRWLADPSAGRWVLVGEGGKGKSAIAYQFCNTVRLSAAGDLAGVFWLSAKRRRYQESTVAELSHPDFHDLDSALNKLLHDYGWTDDTSKSIDAKQAQVLQLLKSLPALIVVDDLDSVEVECEDVVEFLTYDAPRSGSKILITSRRQYVGMSRCSTKVSGLPAADCQRFLMDTAKRFGLGDSATLPPRYSQIAEITEGSPLYMEDLLRLCRQLPVEKAIEKWRQEAGDIARRYALQRERELLSTLSRDVLDACCLAGAALSVAQLERILNRPESQILGALDELERSFLVPGAVLIDDIPTFRVNRNLESLVRRDVRQDPNRLALRNAVDAVVGNRRGRRPDDKAEDYLRQVRVLVASRRSTEGVEIAERSLTEFPNNPDLLATLALAFATSRPSRIVDARRAWERAFQLGLSRRDAYHQWCDFEAEQRDWARMSLAAQNGVSRCGGEKYDLLSKGGYAESRLGQAQARALDMVSAEHTLNRAAELLKQALRSAERACAHDYVISRIYRALVLNGQAMRRGEEITYWMKKWLDWKPDDTAALAECERQAQHFVELRDLLANRR